MEGQEASRERRNHGFGLPLNSSLPHSVSPLALYVLPLYYINMHTKFRTIRIFLSALLFLAVFSFGASAAELAEDDMARLTDEERFGVEDAWIRVMPDGAVLAEWTPSPGCSDYYVTVFRNGKKAAEHVPVRGASASDITEIVAEKGEGTYSFSVFSVRGGPKMKTVSESATITDSEKDKAKEVVEAREDAWVREHGGQIRHLTVKAVERKIKDSRVRKLEFPEGKYYRVTGVSFDVDPDVWLPGKLIRATVTICPKEGYHFTPEMKLDGSANLRSFSAEGEGEERTIRADYVANMQLDKPRALFVTEDGLLVWEEVPFASGYTVIISRMGAAEKTFRTEKAYADISDVREDLDLTDMTIIATGDGTFFRNSEKCEIKDMEKFLGDVWLEGTVSERNGNWYFTYDDGSVAEGWIQLRNNWFYFGKNGRMYRNCLLCEEDGSIYRFNEYGRMLQSELYWDGNVLTYFGADGRMVKNAVTPEGYQVDADGRVVIAQKYIDALENW